MWDKDKNIVIFARLLIFMFWTAWNMMLIGASWLVTGPVIMLTQNILENDYGLLANVVAFYFPLWFVVTTVVIASVSQFKAIQFILNSKHKEAKKDVH
jgi:uncharacterized membrane protein